MYCPRCKSLVDDNALRCTSCGMKLKMHCPKCNSLIPFGLKACSECGETLLKTCPSCKAVNVSTAEKCRKCGHDFNAAATNIVTAHPEIAPSENKNQIIINKILEKSKQDNLKEIPEVIAPEESFSTMEIGNISLIKESEDSVIQNIETEEPVEFIEEKEEQVSQDEFTIVEESEANLSEDFEYEAEQISLEEIPENVAPEEQVIINQEEETEKAEEVSEVEIPQEVDNEPQEEIAPEPLEEKNLQEEEISSDEEKETAEPQNILEPQKRYYSQILAKQKIVKDINKSDEIFIFGINGEEGSGKSVILQYIIKDLEDSKVGVLMGECTPLSQISNFGFLQDLFLKFFGLPAFITDVSVFIKNNKKVFEGILNLLTPDEVNMFINFLYPTLEAEFDCVIRNKQVIYEILHKVFDSIRQGEKLVIVSDNFDLIDASSYDFLLYMIENGAFESGIRILVTYRDRKLVQSYFYLNNFDEKVYETIFLDKLSQEQLETFIGNFVNGDMETIPESIINMIFKNSQGNALYVEQAMAFLYDKSYLKSSGSNVIFDKNYSNIKLPETISEIVKRRLSESVNMTPFLRNALYVAASIGYKFDINVVGAALNMAPEHVQDAFKKLKQLLYVVEVNAHSYSFKNLSLWREIYDIAKNSEIFSENNKKLYEVVKTCVLANVSLKPIIAQSVEKPEVVFADWIDSSKLFAQIGDVNMYVLAQKQALKILSENNFENSLELYNEICEKIGKLIYRTSPVEAITYLSNVISNAKKANDLLKIIDLCAYLVNSCYASGNFFGVVEAVNMILELSEDKISKLDVALVKTRKLKALFSVGNAEEAINIIINDVAPILEEALTKSNIGNYSLDLVYESWLEANLVLANAYSLQGNNKAFEVIDNVLETMAANRIKSRYYETRSLISRAFAYSVSGEVEKSKGIMNQISEAYQSEVMNIEFVSYINLLCIINQLREHNIDSLKNELFSLATFANNANDQFSKNLIKTVLGYVISCSGNLTKALSIYNEQIMYFAKEKIATGALLCWYLISQVSLTIDGTDKALSVLTKALEVAKNPKINNYNFIIYFQKSIAEIYMIKGDLDATKMYLEKSLLIAKQFDLKYAQAELYISYAKYLEETISVKVVNKPDVAREAFNMYEIADKIAQLVDSPYLISEINKARAAFRTYCQLNSIEY